MIIWPRSHSTVNYVPELNFEPLMNHELDSVREAHQLCVAYDKDAWISAGS